MGNRISHIELSKKYVKNEIVWASSQNIIQYVQDRVKESKILKRPIPHHLVPAMFGFDGAGLPTFGTC